MMNNKMVTISEELYDSLIEDSTLGLVLNSEIHDLRRSMDRDRRSMQDEINSLKDEYAMSTEYYERVLAKLYNQIRSLEKENENLKDTINILLDEVAN